MAGRRGEKQCLLLGFNELKIHKDLHKTKDEEGTATDNKIIMVQVRAFYEKLFKKESSIVTLQA